MMRFSVWEIKAPLPSPLLARASRREGAIGLSAGEHLSVCQPLSDKFMTGSRICPFLFHSSSSIAAATSAADALAPGCFFAREEDMVALRIAQRIMSGAHGVISHGAPLPWLDVLATRDTQRERKGSHGEKNVFRDCAYRCFSRGRTYEHSLPPFHEPQAISSLTPAQWLPKPATSQFPHTKRTLRV